jgi:hypothetical protein
VIKGVIVHIANELPIKVDLFEAPGPTASSVRCTNVRTVDGKRPAFIHDPRSTFLLPWHVIRLMEVPAGAMPLPEVDGRIVVSDPIGAVGYDPDTIDEPEPEPEPEPAPEPIDEEPDEDLLARIRSI